MKRFYCNGKKGYCNRGNDNNIDCKDCEFANGTGGNVVDVPDKVCKYCNIPIYIKGNNGEYLELPNNVCPMWGEEIPFAPKETNEIKKGIKV